MIIFAKFTHIEIYLDLFMKPLHKLSMRVALEQHDFVILVMRFDLDLLFQYWKM